MARTTEDNNYIYGIIEFDSNDISDYDTAYSSSDVTPIYISGGWTTAPSKHPMDKNYPHKCFKCGRDLKWKELLDRNIKLKCHYIHIAHEIVFSRDFLDRPHHKKVWKNWDEQYQEYKKLKKIWRSKYVQFYCCNCYYDNLL